MLMSMLGLGGCFSLALTEREKQILRLKKSNMSDYKIARKLRIDAGNVTRSRLTTLRKIERAQADLEFALQVGVKLKV
jgi:transcriptional regulator